MIPLAEYRAEYRARHIASGAPRWRCNRMWLHNPDEASFLRLATHDGGALLGTNHTVEQDGYVRGSWSIEGFTYRSAHDGRIYVVEGRSADMDCHPHYAADDMEVALDLNSGEVWSGDSNRGWSPFQPCELEGWLWELTASRWTWAAIYDVKTKRRRHGGDYRFSQTLTLCHHGGDGGWVLL